MRRAERILKSLRFNETDTHVGNIRKYQKIGRYRGGESILIQTRSGQMLLDISTGFDERNLKPVIHKIESLLLSKLGAKSFTMYAAIRK